MENMLKNGKATREEYRDIFIHWYKWLMDNGSHYGNINDYNQGEHLEITITRLRVEVPNYASCARGLISELKKIITLYEQNKDFFDQLYSDKDALYADMCAHAEAAKMKWYKEILAAHEEYKIAQMLGAVLAKANEMPREELIFRINAITGKTTAKSVGTVMHRLHSVINHLAGHSVSFFGNDSCNCTSGGDSYPTFYFHIGSFPFRIK